MADKTIVIGECRVARQQLLDQGSRAATALDAIGVREGDAIALLIRNDPCYFEVLHAAALLGAYVVPLNWHSKADEIGYILADCTPRALIGHSDLIAAAQPVIPAELPTFIMDDAAATASSSPSPFHARDWPLFRDNAVRWEQPARAPRGTMIYTSGTTGHPKGVRRAPMTPEQIKKNAALLREIYGIEAGMRAFVCGPLYHASPGAFARQAFQHADLTVLQQSFDPEDLLRVIAEYRITHLTMVPTMFVRLLRLADSVRGRYDLSSIRWVTHTGAACPPDVKRGMIEWWGPVIHETYGATETGAAVGCNTEEWLAHPGTVGRPMTGTELRIYDEAGREVAQGGIGEIYLRTEAYSDFTYHGRPEQRSEVDRSGLVTCGDVGYLDVDGFLYLCDRKRDMVISGGVNIYPAEIENVLVNCPGVRDCAVFGVPDAEFGESLIAAIEAEPDAEPAPADVMAFLERRLARFKVPKRFVFETLPREASGKIFKRKLRDRYLQSGVPPM
ncbi:AMP-binding protein [Bradyrhizobium sp. Arg68]|uniref:AMP-binding protein n=1 Tax=Bradyrhizobium ivorense TaxID=2511166 RepID=UPI001E5FDBBA|nr:AMP-binding protein [Bradyrhizobium ivorense]MCC8936245.1 AMP-binding protein [Bradyrhizobium ivorense]